MGRMKDMHIETEELGRAVLDIYSDNSHSSEFEAVDDLGEYLHDNGWISPTEREAQRQQFIHLIRANIHAHNAHGLGSVQAVSANMDIVYTVLDVFGIDIADHLGMTELAVPAGK